MSNTNETQGQGEAQGAEYSDVMKMFNDYENKSDDNNKPKLSKEAILARYFTPRNGVENFRILPPLAGRDIIEKAFFHYVVVNKPVANGKGWRKIYCPSHNSPRVPKLDADGNIFKDESGNQILVAQKCPLCERAEAIKKNLDNSIKYIKKENMTAEQLKIREANTLIYREAGKWEAKKYHIVRGIDKGMPKDGVKYWRFKENFKSQGVLDKLVPALKLFNEQHGIRPYDIAKGTDLYINVVDSKMPNGNTFKDVSSITARNPSKLYDDDIIVKQWLADTSTWRDVFKEASMTRVLNSAEYLEKVATGTDPYWDDRDQENKRYVFPDPADADLMIKANEKTESLDADTTTTTYEMASDVVGDSYGVNITNVTSEDVGTDVDDSVNVGAEFAQTTSQPATDATTVAQEQAPVEKTPVAATTVTQPATPSINEELDGYDDLPF